MKQNLIIEECLIIKEKNTLRIDGSIFNYNDLSDFNLANLVFEDDLAIIQIHYINKFIYQVCQDNTFFPVLNKYLIIDYAIINNDNYFLETTRKKLPLGYVIDLEIPLKAIFNTDGTIKEIWQNNKKLDKIASVTPVVFSYQSLLVTNDSLDNLAIIETQKKGKQISTTNMEYFKIPSDTYSLLSLSKSNIENFK